ncbi:hypothetical protein [Variovorax sp. RO1]|uniref:hypothetical protein n=1 Tax=Variovorax sp. RO1 TaxID=2066034 RepID=UPI0015DE231A|nr:hypothetical protein [Variovorax sp. RO1]
MRLTSKIFIQQRHLGEAPTIPTKGRMGLVQIVSMPADALDPKWRVGAAACAVLLHKHLPEHSP